MKHTDPMYNATLSFLIALLMCVSGAISAGYAAGRDIRFLAVVYWCVLMVRHLIEWVTYLTDHHDHFI